MQPSTIKWVVNLNDEILPPFKTEAESGSCKILFFGRKSNSLEEEIESIIKANRGAAEGKQ